MHTLTHKPSSLPNFSFKSIQAQHSAKRSMTWMCPDGSDKSSEMMMNEGEKIGVMMKNKINVSLPSEMVEPWYCPNIWQTRIQLRGVIPEPIVLRLVINQITCIIN